MPEFPTTVRDDEPEDIHTEQTMPAVALPMPKMLESGERLFGVAWRQVKGASGTGWERIEFMIPSGLIEALPHKRHEFDLPRIVQGAATEYLQNVIEQRVDAEYFK